MVAGAIKVSPIYAVVGGEPVRVPDWMRDKETRRRKRSTGSLEAVSVVIESLVYLDYSIWDWHLRYNNMSVSDALLHLYTFYSHIWNEVSCVRGGVWEGITPEGGGHDEENIWIRSEEATTALVYCTSDLLH